MTHWLWWGSKEKTHGPFFQNSQGTQGQKLGIFLIFNFQIEFSSFSSVSPLLRSMSFAYTKQILSKFLGLQTYNVFFSTSLRILVSGSQFFCLFISLLSFSAVQYSFTHSNIDSSTYSSLFWALEI